jgi:hypothetical protein
MMNRKLTLDPSDAIPSPTVTADERRAAKVIEALWVIEELVPELEVPHPSKSGRARGARTVTRRFIASMSVAVEDAEELQRLGRFDPDEARAVFQFNDAFRPVADRMAVLLATLNHTMESRKAKVAGAALDTYAAAKRYARNRRSKLTLHVERLRRDLGRKNGTSGKRRQG